MPKEDIDLLDTMQAPVRRYYTKLRKDFDRVLGEPRSSDDTLPACLLALYVGMGGKLYRLPDTTHHILRQHWAGLHLDIDIFADLRESGVAPVQVGLPDKLIEGDILEVSVRTIDTAVWTRVIDACHASGPQDFRPMVALLREQQQKLARRA